MESKESKEDCVDLKGLTSEALEKIIDFIYSGEMEFEFDNLTEMLNASSHLQVHTALDLCSDYMISLLTFSNSEDLLHIADTYCLTKVTSYFNNKVLTSFEEFSQTEQFYKLTAQQLARYLADDGLKVKSESILYDIVAKWYHHDQSRLESMDNLLKCVRFSLLSDTQLNQLRQHWLTGQFPNSMNYISDGLKYHTDSNMGHPWLSNSSRLRSKERSLTMIHQGSSYRPFEITACDNHEGKFYQLLSDNCGSRDCRVVSVDNYVYICRVVDCGGGTLMNSLLRFDPRHLKLQELTPCRRLRIDPALTAKDQWLYLFGGTNEHYNTLDTVECYDTRSNSWIDLLPLPIPLHQHSATVCKRLVFVCGGVSGPERQPVQSMYSYDTATHHWESKANMHCSRRLHEMAVLGETIYVLGGIGAHSFHQQTQIPIESYSPNTNQWTLLTSTLAGRCVGHFVPYQNQILSIGREHYEAAEDDIWIYDREADSWKRFMKVPRRSGLASTSGTTSATLLYLNFADEKITKRVLTDKR